MTLEQLDALRGYCIAAIILAVLAIGVTALIQSAKIQRLVRAAAAAIGGLAGLAVFVLFTFISGWDEYFAAKAASDVASEYRGRRQAAARVIRTVGEMEVSTLGFVFGAVGLALLAVAYIQFRALRKP